MLKYLVKLLVKIHPLCFLIASVHEMGWGVAVEKDRDICEGLVIGTDDYIDRHIEEGIDE